jgi:hypothetical protein
MFQSQ